MPSAATTPWWLSAISSARRHESIPVPIVTIRVTPASFARATTASGSAHASRWAWLSVTPRSRARPRAGRAAEPARGPRRRAFGRTRPRPRRRVRWLPQRLEDALGRAGQVGGQRDPHGAQAVHEVVEHAVELVRSARRPSQAATAPSASTCLFSARTTSQIRSSAPVRSNASRASATSLPSGSSSAATGESSAGHRGECAAAVARDHRRHAREEVPEVVAELTLVALAEPVDRRDSVLPERDRPRAPEAHRVGAVDVDQLEWVDDVAERLRDLAIVEQAGTRARRAAAGRRTRPRAAAPASRHSGSGGCPSRADVAPAARRSESGSRPVARR